MRRDPGFVKVFNKIAVNYDKRFGKSCQLAHELILLRAQDCSIKPQNILDIGCGTGELLLKTTKIWPSALSFGIDPAQGMIEQAKTKLSHSELSVNRSETLPFLDDSIDLVVSTTSFSHWMDKHKSLTEIYRVLKPQGDCIIVDHYTPGLMTKLILFLINRLADLKSVFEVDELAKRAGFTVKHLSKVESYFIAHLIKA
ncbi:MAG: methyltransferase domain-containing protein [Pseudomonadota bacterium]